MCRLNREQTVFVAESIIYHLVRIFAENNSDLRCFRSLRFRSESRKPFRKKMINKLHMPLCLIYDFHRRSGGWMGSDSNVSNFPSRAPLMLMSINKSELWGDNRISKHHYRSIARCETFWAFWARRESVGWCLRAPLLVHYISAGFWFRFEAATLHFNPA